MTRAEMMLAFGTGPYRVDEIPNATALNPAATTRISGYVRDGYGKPVCGLRWRYPEALCDLLNREWKAAE